MTVFFAWVSSHHVLKQPAPFLRYVEAILRGQLVDALGDDGDVDGGFELSFARLISLAHSACTGQVLGLAALEFVTKVRGELDIDGSASQVAPLEAMGCRGAGALFRVLDAAELLSGCCGLPPNLRSQCVSQCRPFSETYS